MLDFYKKKKPILLISLQGGEVAATFGAAVRDSPVIHTLQQAQHLNVHHVDLQKKWFEENYVQLMRSGTENVLGIYFPHLFHA